MLHIRNHMRIHINLDLLVVLEALVKLLCRDGAGVIHVERREDVPQSLGVRQVLPLLKAWAAFYTPIGQIRALWIVPVGGLLP